MISIVISIAIRTKTRLDEQHLVQFTFQVAQPIELPSQARWLIFIVWTPVGYSIPLLDELMDVRDSSYLVEDAKATNGEGLRMRSLGFGLDLEASNSRMAARHAHGFMIASLRLRFSSLCRGPGAQELKYMAYGSVSSCFGVEE